MLSLGVGITDVNRPTVSGDVNVLDWISRVNSNGGSVSTGAQSAVETLVTALKTAGVWPKIQRMNLFAGTGLAACAVPLINTAGGTLDTLTNFVESDYSESTGLTGDGSTKYVRTGITASASFSLASFHWAAYHRGTGSGTFLGCAVSPNSGNRIMAQLAGGQVYSDLFADVSGGRVNTGISAPYGMVTGSRTSATDTRIFKAGTQIAAGSGGNGALPAAELYVMAWNLGGPFSGTFLAGPLAMYSVGAGLTPTEVADFATAIQTFQTALGRNV